ncbi:hypothetical protein Cal7507_1164 [Calothrix sp. PCC 7507]|nr:hypothetical protein Cal7507_1164 [Calothrix sp. PCC 7507]
MIFPHQIYRVTSFVLSISILSLFSSNLTTALDKPSISRKNSYLFTQIERLNSQQLSNSARIAHNFKDDELLIVGNPTVPRLPGEKTPQLLPIPGAEEEAKAIAKIFKTQAITGNAATETAILRKITQAKIIHLAAHVIELNNSNAIALAPSDRDDGWLSSADIQKLHLKADLVVLRAGKTALGKITGDGVMGLSRAFMVAGAESVIASLWEVDDMAMSFLMTNFYKNLSKNPDKADALRKAILETMKKYPNPEDWAGFISIGLL